MTETQFLDSSNYGAWSAYRKKCSTKEDQESKYCKHLHDILFLEKKTGHKNNTHIDLSGKIIQSHMDLKKKKKNE